MERLNKVEILNDTQMSMQTEEKPTTPKETSFDVRFSPIVNVRCVVADKDNLTFEEEYMICRKAIEKVKNEGLIDKILGQNLEEITIYEDDEQ